MADYGLSAYDANGADGLLEIADYYEATVAVAGKSNAKPCANWVMVDLAARLNKEEGSRRSRRFPAAQLGGLVARIADNTDFQQHRQEGVRGAVERRGHSADEIIEKQGLKQITDTGAIEALIDEVLAANARWSPNSRPARKRRSMRWSARR